MERLQFRGGFPPLLSGLSKTFVITGSKKSSKRAFFGGYVMFVYLFTLHFDVSI